MHVADSVAGTKMSSSSLSSLSKVTGSWRFWVCFHPIILAFYTDIDSEFRQQDVFLGVLKSSRLGLGGRFSWGGCSIPWIYFEVVGDPPSNSHDSLGLGTGCLRDEAPACEGLCGFR